MCSDPNFFRISDRRPHLEPQRSLSVLNRRAYGGKHGPWRQLDRDRHRRPHETWKREMPTGQLRRNQMTEKRAPQLARQWWIIDGRGNEIGDDGRRRQLLGRFPFRCSADSQDRTLTVHELPSDVVAQRSLAEGAARFGHQNRFHTTSHFRNVRALVCQTHGRR